MTREEVKSCIGTIEMLQRLAYNIHGVMDVIDADNCKKIIKALEQEPCEDAISRQAVLEGLRTCYDTETKEYSDGSQWINYEDAVAEMENLPSVTSQPTTGHWIVNKKVDTAYDISGYKSWAISYACEHCGFIHQAIENHGVYSYCPNCGARMVEPQESEVQE